MVNTAYIPERGDIIQLNFNPQKGHEQAGARPALVLSPKVYNEKVGLALVCPITSQIKGYPFEVLLPERFSIKGAILSDHVKSLDWRARASQYLCRVSPEVLNEVFGKLKTLLEPYESIGITSWSVSAPFKE